ncbi:GerAB/ArcD/ProY family transporter [Aquibacillus rhizosphaerae]|uniref:GerAB/ArcD/ProY family transporter n=1 Tax=Aquibacillus rhizosphaerae TaxID=3051431 RepID=A0ABT7L3I3_9BACI|nr:GerAB/ArcD/ProY family transporter [Aquibacillus sp. LR5S19]MDL4840419.1 GerAB/ArcD/ProY family transporter [Aquibacillus sp. LR5S19]
MDVNITIRPGLRVKAFYLFFIISSIQTGTGIMSTPRYIFKEAKQDAWISVIIAGLCMHLIIFVMFAILKKYKNTDIFGIQTDLFGKWISRVLGTIFIIYLFSSLVSILINYIQVVQVFIYPMLSPWLLSIMILSIVTYAVLGGLRVAVGVTFTFFILTLWLIFFLYKPMTLMDFGHFKPMFEATPMELLKGARATTYSFLGLEILFFLYPFIDNKKKAQLPTQLGIVMTTFLVLLVTFISIGFFGGDLLERSIWPVLILYKLIEYAVIERFDLIIVTQWMMVIVPNMILITWMISYGLKRMYQLPQKKAVYGVVFLLFICGGLIRDQFTIQLIIDYVAQVGFWIVFIYPFVLYPLVIIKKKMNKNRGNHS